MKDISKFIDNLPVKQFEGNNRSNTIFQVKCLELLTNHLKANKAIRRDDIIQWYMDCLAFKHPKGIQDNWYSREDNRWYFDIIPLNKHYEQNAYKYDARAISYFKNVLGQCIINGKLLAIPLIEI